MLEENQRAVVIDGIYKGRAGIIDAIYSQHADLLLDGPLDNFPEPATVPLAFLRPEINGHG